MSDLGPRPPFYVEAHPLEALRTVFAGRDGELRRLEQMLSQSGGSPAFVVGPSGVGKTALCRAHEQLRGQYHRGSVFARRRNSARRMHFLDYIDFQRGQIVNQVPVPQAGPDMDTRVLVVVDDVDRFSDQEASYLLTMLHARSPYCVSLCTSRERFRFLETSEIPSLELRLGPLPQSSLGALLANHIAASGGDRAHVEQFLTALGRQGLQTALPDAQDRTASLQLVSDRGRSAARYCMLYIGVECVAGNCVTAPALSSTIHSQMRSAMYIALTACSDVPSLGTHLDAARSFALRFPDGHEPSHI